MVRLDRFFVTQVPAKSVCPVSRSRCHSTDMKTYPSPGEYVAFSLRVAHQKIAEMPAGQNYRTVYPEVYNLGGINQIHGLVYDRQTQDVILVGKYDPERQPLTLNQTARDSYTAVPSRAASARRSSVGLTLP